MTNSELYSVDEFLDSHRISRTQFYREIANSRLMVVKRGRRTFITPEAAAAWRESLQPLKTGAAA
jgi:hypothetical protein